MVECGLVYMWVCACKCECAAVRAHTCAPCMPPCMVAFKHAFAALREERGIPVGDERVRVCASSDHIALTPILSYILPPFS